MEKIKKIFKELYSYIIIIIIVILFRTFVATPVRVDGDSMNDKLTDGDILILNKLENTFERFDIVVISVEINGKNTKIIKRIIGLPGENISYKDNNLYINGENIDDNTSIRTNNFTLEELYNIDQIPDNYYFVMGDNRTNSLDSRDYRIGLIKENQIQGKVIVRIFPFNKIGVL